VISHEDMMGIIATEAAEAAAGSSPSTGSLKVELAKLKAENERLKDIVRRCNSDWCRLRDFILVCNGPTEACRFWDEGKKLKGVEIFIAYITSLWDEAANRKSENAEGQAVGAPSNGSASGCVCKKCGQPMVGYPGDDECSDCAFPILKQASDAAARALEEAHYERTGERKTCGELLRKTLGM
jgi:hypothetical protein